MEKGLGVPIDDLTERDAGGCARWLGIWTPESMGSLSLEERRC